MQAAALRLAHQSGVLRLKRAVALEEALMREAALQRARWAATVRSTHQLLVNMQEVSPDDQSAPPLVRATAASVSVHQQQTSACQPAKPPVAFTWPARCRRGLRRTDLQTEPRTQPSLQSSSGSCLPCTRVLLRRLLPPLHRARPSGLLVPRPFLPACPLTLPSQHVRSRARATFLSCLASWPPAACLAVRPLRASLGAGQ